MRAGQLIGERFEIERLAGEGGMGAVYRALDRLTGQPAAVKVLHPSSGARDTDRFLREGAVLADLTHPGIVRYLSHGFTDEQEAYLAMEWLEGEDLADRIARAQLTQRESIAIVRATAQALTVAHARGVVHRDIKPSNVFLVDRDIGRVKVLDFGIARRDAAMNMTRTGAVLGTPGYMAPEQARGEKDLDARADVFALGCVLFECIAGRPPFVADNLMALLAKILLEDAPHLREIVPDVTEALDALLARLLAKDRASRPADAHEVIAQLAAIGETSDELQNGRGTPPQAITRGERRSFSLVLIRGIGAPDDDSSPSFESGLPRTRGALDVTVVAPMQIALDPLAQIRSVAMAWGGRAEALADGSVVVTIATRDMAADHAVRAARCAIALQQVVPHAVVAVATGRGEMFARWPVGEVIDEAAYLLRDTPKSVQILLPSGTPPPIRINEVIAGLLDTRFDVHRGAATLELRAERDSARTLLGKPTLCVGRDRELAALDATFSECTDESLARVVLVTASAGVGKSRLRHEFVRRLAARPNPPTVLLARGDPMRAGAPFGMLAQALRAAFDIRENEPIETRREKLAARIDERLSNSSARFVGEFIGEIIGVPPADPGPALKAARQDAGAMNDQLLRAWLEFLTAECAARPMVIVLEDLQWGDRPSCGFIDAALRDLAQSPLLVMALARPEIDDVFPKLWAERGVAGIRLPDMPKKAAERLARQVLGGQVPQETIDGIVLRSAGNAFFLEELIRSVAEGKGDSLPGTILAMAEARLESLDGDDRRVLRAASVFGQAFWDGGVRSLLGMTAKPAQVTERLQSLAQRELITRRGESKFRGEFDYGFRQGLMREAAYAMLTPADRTLAHKLAGNWLEAMGETEAATLAEHFERGGEPAKAIEWYRKAGQSALEGNDVAAVLNRVDRGIACGAAGETLGTLLVLRTEALMWTGAYRDSQKRALEALELLSRGSETWFKALGLAIWLSRNVNDRQTIVRLAEVLRAQGRSPEAGGAPAMPWALALWSVIMLRQYEIAAELTRWVEELHAQTAPDDTRTLAWTHFGMHFARLHLGDPEVVYRDAQAAVRHFLAFGDRMNGGAALSCLMRVALAVGQDEEAERSVRDAIEMTSQHKLGALIGASKRFQSYLWLRRGAIEQAVPLMREAVQFLADEKNDALVALWQTDFSIQAAIVKQWDVAEAAVTPWLEALRAAPPTRALAQMVLARVCAARGRFDAAVEYMREGDAVFASMGRIGDNETFVRLVRAEVLRGAGRLTEARTAIDEARAGVLTVATRIKDLELRNSFLTRVPENLQVLALADEAFGSA